MSKFSDYELFHFSAEIFIVHLCHGILLKKTISRIINHDFVMMSMSINHIRNS